MADAPFVSLYRRFRPGNFGDLKGQDHVVRALQSAVRDDRVSHAYLFSGPRGTGKTSTARILAKALNCEAPIEGEPCDACMSCQEITQGTSLNVHELDAASNNGVDAMRDLVAHAGLGTPGRWKVYIIDEVHMLSTAAANALLKTLEEPPTHVVFVLATTDPQRVPPTIRSRTQHLEFRLLGTETLQGLLASVRTQAELDVDDEAIEAAVRRGRGSARDALSALDQVAASGGSDSARPELTLLLEAVAEGDVTAALTSLSALAVAGWGPQQLATELVDDLRQLFLASLAPELCSLSGLSRDRLTELAENMGLPRVVRSIEIMGRALVDMREAPDAQVVLEISIVRAGRPDLDSGIEALSERVGSLERMLSSGVRPQAVSEPEKGSPPSPIQPTPQADVGQRPSLGAIRRGKESASGGTANPPDAGVQIEPEKIAHSDRAIPETAREAMSVDRDSLTEAWGDGILRTLPSLVKALYSGGRFVSVDAHGAQFALPTAPHRDRCAEYLPDVEAALAHHFRTPVKLVLVVDETRPGAPSQSHRPDSGPRTGPDQPSDVDEFEDEARADLIEATGTEPDQASEAEARLLEAFPGASEVVS